MNAGLNIEIMDWLEGWRRAAGSGTQRRGTPPNKERGNEIEPVALASGKG